MRLASVLLGLHPTPLASRIGPNVWNSRTKQGATKVSPPPRTQTRGYPSAPSRAYDPSSGSPDRPFAATAAGKEGMYMARVRAVPSVASFVLALSVIIPSRGTGQCCGSGQCPGDLNCDGRVTINELITAVNSALAGCPPSVCADQACADFALANCTKLDDCVLNGTSQRYGGASTCRQRQKEICLVRLGATGTGNNPTAIEQCVSETAPADCNDFDAGNIPECEAKIGSGANGTPCAFGGQCQSTNCAIVTGSNCGTCAPASSAGDSCTTTSCSHGFACVTVGTTQECEPIGSAGAACGPGIPCGAGLSCVTASGTCQVSGTSVGAACDPKHQTAPGCDGSMGFSCNGATCAAITYATAGEPCGLVGQVVYGCTNAATCFVAQGQTQGTCIADAADGAPCNTEIGPFCVPPAQCVTNSPEAVSGTCRFPDPTKCH